MLSHEAVLFTNEAFYRAFAEADLAAMDTLWARDTAVACIHPGWTLLNERTRIMDVWRRLFASGDSGPVLCRAPQAYVIGDAAFVICFEQLPQALLIATNIFRKERGQWRMVHHQSGATTAVPAHLAETRAPSLRPN